jgi:hypothetical protein
VANQTTTNITFTGITMSISFNAASVPVTETSFSPIPAGNYNVKINDAVMKPFAGNKPGRKLTLTLELLDGQFARRKLWKDLNVEHAEAEQRGYAQKDLASLMRCINVQNIDEQTLHLLCNKPLKIRVIVKQDKTYGDKNEIKGFEALGQGQVMPSMPTMPAAPAANAAPQAPWAKAA